MAEAQTRNTLLIDALEQALKIPQEWCSVVRYPSHLPGTVRGGVCTVGNFDGVHRGHRHVLQHMHSAAPGAPRHLVSFYPHPVQVVRGVRAPPQITPLHAKSALLAGEGVSGLYLVHFTRALAQMSAEDFIQEIFLTRMGISHLVVGEDAAIGRGRQGDASFLREYLPKVGISLTVVKNHTVDGIRPSSRVIRAAVEKGDVGAVPALLGRYHSIIGKVVRGDGRGKSIGTPTANLAVGGVLLPPHGVYACGVRVKGLLYPGVANIGTRPTFGGVGTRLEVHIMLKDADQLLNLYGARLAVAFIERIRDEKRFESVEALRQQIEHDKSAARCVLSPLLLASGGN